MNLSIYGIFVAFLLLLPLTLHAENLRYTVIEPHHHNVYAARFTPDGMRTVSVDDDGVLIEWDFISKRIVRRAKAPFTPADMGIALTRDAAKAAFVGKDGKTVIYDLAARSFTEIPFAMPAGKDAEREACCIAISDDGKVVFVGDNQGAVYRSENGAPFAQFSPTGKLNRQEEQITALALSPDGKTLAVGRLGMIKLIHAESGEPVWMLPHDQISFSVTISFSPDSTLVSAGIPGRISFGHANQELPVWEVQSGRKLHSFTMADGMAYFGGFSRDNKLALCASSRSAYLFDLATGKQVGSTLKPTEKPDARWQMDTSPDGKYLLVSGGDGLLQVYETARILSDKEPKALASLESRVSMVEALAFSPDGGALLISYKEASPQVFDLNEKKLRERLKCNHDVREFLFSAGETKVLAAGPYFIGQWSWPKLEPLPTVEFTNGERNYEQKISPDGASAVVLANDVLKFEDGINWMIPELLVVDLNKGTIPQKYLLRDLQDTIARFYRLACVDFTTNSATVIDSDGRGQDADGRRPSTWNSPTRALIYSLADGKQLRIIDSKTDKAGTFDCDKMVFKPRNEEGEPEQKPLHFYKNFVSGRFLLRSDDGSVTVIDREKDKPWRLKTFATTFHGWENSNQIECMAISADGRLLAIGTNKGDVGLYDVKKGKWLGTYLYLGYKEWIWYTADGIINASKGGSELVRKVIADGK